MTRIPSHSVADAPDASRSLLAVLTMLALRSGWRQDEAGRLHGLLPELRRDRA